MVRCGGRNILLELSTPTFHRTLAMAVHQTEPRVLAVRVYTYIVYPTFVESRQPVFATLTNHDILYYNIIHIGTSYIILLLHNSSTSLQVCSVRRQKHFGYGSGGELV